jgi:NAD dependent epimerase/dehydratase family enzyme
MKSIPKINKRESLLLLGHKGLIGSALLKQLKSRNYKNIITIEKNKKNNNCCSKSWRNCSECKISF